MTPFDFQLKTRMVFGPDSVERLGELVRELGAKRVLVVSDPGIVAAGHVQHGIDSLQKSNIETHLFGEAHPNPTTDDVENGLAVARDYQPDLIVGMGGGSSMDCAKGINFVYSCGGTMHDYEGVGRATAPMLPMIAVPTTAGTGSEMQSFALISDAQTHRKMPCGDKKATCRVAVLDPKLTLTQPPMVAALTGIDAISHAIETYVTKRRNPVSLHYSRESWRLLSQHFPRVLQSPDDLESRAAVQLGAAYAGVAIENSMLGASHALANPLTATYGVTHGQAVGAMLPHVIRFNGAEFDHWYRELLETCQDAENAPAPEAGAEGLAQFVAGYVELAGLQVKLDSLGVETNRLPELATDAARQWTGTFNPREVNEHSLLGLYESAL